MIDSQKAKETASLINLRVRFHIRALDEGVQRYLESVQYGEYSSYVSLTPGVDYLPESDDDSD